MRKVGILIVGIALAGTLGAHPAFPEIEEEIPLSKVPKKVMEAAKKAVEGIRITEAEKIDRGKNYEIEIAAKGKILKISKSDGD
jgi:hypothetical protein